MLAIPPAAHAAPIPVRSELTIKGTRYAVRSFLGCDGTEVVRLAKLAGRGEVYDVSRGDDGLVCCTCGDYENRKRGTDALCKHGVAAVEAGLILPPAPVPAAEYAARLPIPPEAPPARSDRRQDSRRDDPASPRVPARGDCGAGDAANIVPPRLSYSEGFGEELRFAVFGPLRGDEPAESVPVGPDPVEAAWDLGFALGEDLGEPDADPSSDLSPFAQEAFMDGFDKGRREAEAERMEFASRYDAETLESMMAHEDLEAYYHEAETADANISRKAV